jgi:DNA-binding winged helix-turn-helix (wHTH) protein/predicted ATPase
VIRFGHFQLDRTQGLRRAEQEVHLTPKALSVLCALAERPGEVVTKEELFRTVWSDTAVSDSALTSCIQELRQALHDQARRPEFIQTLNRRGYRFLGLTAATQGDEPPSVVLELPVRTDAPTVGREAVMAQMLEAYALVQQNARQVLFVTGEAGIGKTTAVQALLATIAARGGVRTTWGQCVQHYGVGEPYQPLLEALSRLCRQAGGHRLIPVLERYSPTWLAQLPGLLTPERLATLRRTAAGTTRERMLRELTDAAEAIASQETLVLWLEDLHWSDSSTLDWIAAFAQRPEPTRLLLIGTFRPPSATGPENPLAHVSEFLRHKGFCRQIELSGLDGAGVGEYAALRFPPAPDHSEGWRRLTRLIHQHTRGNPLFVVNVMSDLAARGVILPQDGRWKLSQDANRPELRIPDDVRRTIEQQADRLLPMERAVLEVASVAGATVSTAAVAAVPGFPPNESEGTLAALARRHQFVREAGTVEWPDGTIGTRFDFLHVLYRDVLYQRVPAGRRAMLHRQVGTREEQAYGDRAPEIAAELAMHFERSGDLRRAGIYLQHAAENARARGAYQEACTHFARALALLASEPPGPERSGRELILQIGRGAAAMAASGWSAPEAEEAYSRARVLSHELADKSGLFPALWGLWLFDLGRGRLSTAHELVQDLLGLAHKHGDEALLLQAHHAAWATAFTRGDLETASRHFAEGAVYQIDRHAGMAATYGSHDVGVCCHNFSGWAQALLGRTEAADHTSDEGIALARSLGHPFSLALALVFAAAVSQTRRDVLTTKTRASEALAIAREQDFRLLSGSASTLEGWAAVGQREYREGLQLIEKGLAEVRATGSNSFLLPYFLGLQAEAQLKSGQAPAGLAVVNEAIAIAQRTGERFWEAELHRLKGELELVSNVSSATCQAQQALLQAIEVARGQGANLLVLRAAVSLGRLWRRLDRKAEARKLVTEACGSITEGVTLPDIVDANAFLSEDED